MEEIFHPANDHFSLADLVERDDEAKPHIDENDFECKYQKLFSSYFCHLIKRENALMLILSQDFSFCKSHSQNFQSHTFGNCCLDSYRILNCYLTSFLGTSSPEI